MSGPRASGAPSPLRVLFRADASSTLGLGHLVRCLTLADAFAARGHACTFAAARPEPGVAGLVARRGFPLRALEVDPGSEDDARATGALLSELDAAIAIVDGYGFHQRLLGSLHRTGRCVGYLDDLATAALPCRCVIAPSLSARPADYEALPGRLVLAGARFELIRPEFMAARALRAARAEGELRRVVVVMGGADPTCETPKVLEALALLPEPLEVRVVVGAMNPRHEEIAAKARALGGPHALEVERDPASLGERFAWGDLVISAAGGTLSEACCVGVPAIAIVVADNQRRVGATFDASGLARVLGWHADVTPASIAAAVRELSRDRAARAAMVARQRAAIDGEGARRVAEAIEAIAR